jgi:hypothetical protein
VFYYVRQHLPGPALGLLRDDAGAVNGVLADVRGFGEFGVYVDRITFPEFRKSVFGPPRCGSAVLLLILFRLFPEYLLQRQRQFRTLIRRQVAAVEKPLGSAPGALLLLASKW